MKSIFSILTIFALNFSTAQIQNFGFENTTNSFPDKWSVRKIESYDWKIDNNQKHQGKNSFLITGNSVDIKTFQQFSQVIPIPGKGLRKIELSAYIQSKNINGKIGLWTQIWNANKEKIGFESFDSQNKIIPVNNDWAKYSLEFVIDDNAKNLLIGGVFSGKGNVWFDDFEVKEIALSDTKASKIASDYIEHFKNLIKTKSMFRDKIDWNIVDENIKKLSLGTETIEDTKPAIQYMMNVLKGSGDIHSFIVSKKRTDTKKTKNIAGIEPESKLIDSKIGYVMVPAFSTSNTEVGNQFASKINEMIKKLDSDKEINGWIIDLRTNSGGSMHPMILGLGSLVGDGTLGYFITKENKVPWILENGKFKRNEIAQPYKLKNPSSKIAILIGKKTASSGEATAISFIGKDNVKLFGQPTRGLTSGNSTHPLSDGRALALATSFEMDRTGKEYREKIHPDVLIEPSTEKDLELETAKNWILE